ncbi:R3H and coiled-coil domain-containing protein 1 isoform X1 [Nasonia vitripennis]|uniref:R3H domain-containing protein n=2 Tax=Nasonia vitripennis TaxID=7425 RepID=A0A7M7GBF8_NASVI|nr:R3H and coiled-coil domain-containing protein 1 isoform X1 [Nasonia vitripennis]
MSLQDNLFAEDAEEDLQLFLKSDKRRRVLLFPPVNNYRRFLIHQLVQDNFGDLLQTFSIGQGYARRTVVCYKSDFIGPPQVNGVSSQATNNGTGKSSDRMGIESQCTPTASPEHSANKSRQVKSTPAYEIYRPPAARRARLEKSPAGPASTEPTQMSSDASARANRQKRPDRAVYVPRHRRGAADVDVPPQDPPTPPKPSKESSRSTPKPMPIEKMQTDPQPSVPKEMPTAVTPAPETIIEKIDDYNETEKADQEIPKETPPANDLPDERMEEDVVTKSEVPLEPVSTPEAPKEEAKPEIAESPVCLDESDKRDRRKSDEIVREPVNESAQKRDEAIRNKRNDNKAVKKALISPVLIISTKEEEEKEAKKSPAPVFPVVAMTPPEKKVKKVERPKSKPAPPPAPPVKINRDEADWDSLFDDNGDCLDPTLIEELSSAVGEVVIEKPKSKSFTRPVEVSNDEYGHVLEIYNFPSEFKSSDLVAVFSPFKSNGFELKWVDETHCLGVFSSPLVAAEVLASDHPFVKTRPLSEATALSKSKARRSSEFLQPYRTRPETCAALARRLVTKSLGVTLATARQEREQEKILLREAKEKKRLANKQREDVWEGIITEKPTT